MSQAAFDIVIVGGGLSGLALAAELASPEFSNLRILLLEQRSSYKRDRTWSYWRTASHAYSHLERMRWLQWRVSQEQSRCTHTSTTAYCSLDADAFYQSALDTIGKSQHVEVRLDTCVLEIKGGELPTVRTATGQICAHWVFDARPPARYTGNPLVQQFLGWEVQTSSDVFDATTVDLMSFEPHDKGLHFFYTLPYSARNALVETTWVSPASHQPDYESELQQFLAKRLGSSSYKILYEEKGVLNLQPAAPVQQPHVLSLGRGAGTLRASTGYAFLETLAHTEKIVASLKKARASRISLNKWTPPKFVRKTSDCWMDRIFFDVLQSDWKQGASHFMQLFERVDANTLLAFLSGNASWQQRLLVARALPTLPFAKAALAATFAATFKDA